MYAFLFNYGFLFFAFKAALTAILIPQQRIYCEFLRESFFGYNPYTRTDGSFSFVSLKAVLREGALTISPFKRLFLF